MGEAAERFTSAAKETAENLTDVGVKYAMSETKNGGIIHTCTMDDGSGTLCDDACKAPTLYVILKTVKSDDSNLTGISGPRGEVTVLTVVAVRAETSIKICEDETGICHETRGGEEKDSLLVGRLVGIMTAACDTPHNAFVRTKPSKKDAMEGNVA